VVLRTFSKLWHGRVALWPGDRTADLVGKISSFSGWNSLPVTAVAAALTSLDDLTVVPERNGSMPRFAAKLSRGLTATATTTFRRFRIASCWTPNGRPKKLSKRWRRATYSLTRLAVWPTHVRITVGTKLEMEKFQMAFQEVMRSKPAHNAITPERGLWAHLDGRRVRAI